MATNSGSSGAAGVLVGALLVILVGLAWFVGSGGQLPWQDDAEIKIDLPG